MEETLGKSAARAARNDMTLIFLPGFMARPRDYEALLSPIAGLGVNVKIPMLSEGLLARFSGLKALNQEATAAASLVAQLLDQRLAEDQQVWLAGHSRGGQVAWLAAQRSEPTGLILVDPVDGTGPRSGPVVTKRAPSFGLAPLIIGAEISGSCSPIPLNHERFAEAANEYKHLVVEDCGHADILSGPALKLGRLICGGGVSPSAARATFTDLITLQMHGRLTPESTAKLPQQVAWN